MYKTILFDFFDVVHEDPQKTWLTKHGYKWEGGFREATVKLDLGLIDYKTYIAAYAEHSGQTWEEVHGQFSQAVLDTEVKQLVAELRETYKTGLLSNTTPEEIRPMLTNHGLTELFDEIVISGEVGLRKPDADIFKLVLNRLGANPAETIFVDDNPENVAAAAGLGMTGICFTSCDSLRDELSKLGIIHKQFSSAPRR